MIDNTKILVELKNHLIQNFGNTIKDVILFGSQARGGSKDYSDYDILIVLEKDYSGKDENQILDLCYDIDLKYNILLDVQLLIENDRLRSAVNRIYYGMFYSLLALRLEHKYASSKHSQLIGWFNKNFIRDGLIDSKYGKIINKSFSDHIGSFNSR